ncbi:MAG TPA: helix-turn-helix domain-containing protein [Thermoflexia bacterium]|nr:helix-turn-helix domain-containing protein [Thermoflexia bacterium]
MRDRPARLFTVGEVADLFQVSPRTVFRWMAQGRLPAIRVGNITRIRPEDLEAFFEAHLSTQTRGRPGQRREVGG